MRVLRRTGPQGLAPDPTLDVVVVVTWDGGTTWRVRSTDLRWAVMSYRSPAAALEAAVGVEAAAQFGPGLHRIASAQERRVTFRRLSAAA